MNILITGGSGFIGSALVRHFIHNRQHTILNIDKLTYAANPAALNSITNHPHYHFVQADICNRNTLEQILNKFRPHAVMHLAAESHVDRSLTHTEVFMNTNILGTYQVLEATRQYWQKQPAQQQQSFRFLHISTDEVYGDANHTQAFFKESSPYLPSSPYSASKASSDHLVQAWHRSYGLPTIISHCSNNYGPYQFPEKLIPLMILNALSGKKLPIYGNGQQIRDWLYVEDHIRALELLLTHASIGETYNISAHNQQTNLQIVHAICALLEQMAPNKPQHIQNYTDLITHVQDRPGHDIRYAIDTTKIRQLGWQPQESFESGLFKTVQWYLSRKLTNFSKQMHNNYNFH